MAKVIVFYSELLAFYLPKNALLIAHYGIMGIDN
jgi:hypothetical protein